MKRLITDEMADRARPLLVTLATRMEIISEGVSEDDALDGLRGLLDACHGSVAVDCEALAVRIAVASVEGAIADASRVMQELPAGMDRDHALRALSDAKRWGIMAARDTRLPSSEAPT